MMRCRPASSRRRVSRRSVPAAMRRTAACWRSPIPANPTCPTTRVIMRASAPPSSCRAMSTAAPGSVAPSIPGRGVGASRLDAATGCGGAGETGRRVNGLGAAGVAAVCFPSVALFAAALAVRDAMAALKRDRSLAGLNDQLMPLPDYYELIGLKAQLGREEAYDRAAAALVSQRAAE